MEAIGVLSSWVTALMKLSCCSLRRISRNRKIVLRMSPAVMAPKKITPRKTLMPSRQLRMIHPNPTATATMARQTPSERKKMILPRRSVMPMPRFYRASRRGDYWLSPRHFARLPDRDRLRARVKAFMQVRVLFFGMLKDFAGRESDLLSMPDDCTLADVLSHYQALIPQLSRR